MSDDPFTTHDEPEPWRPRFSLGLIFLVMIVISVGAAAASYLARGSTFHFLLIVLSAPLLLTVAISAIVRLVAWINRR